MKKKNFKNLTLHKYSISNLALLHRKTGGVTNVPGTEVQTVTNPNSANSIEMACTIETASMASDCPTICTTPCQTNGGTSIADAPSEHQGCQANNTTRTSINYMNHMG